MTRRFLNCDKDIVKFDNGGNIFLKGKCINSLSSNPHSVKETGEFVKEAYEGIDAEVFNQPVITGHVPNFSYGSNPDNDNKPYEVNTGQKAW